MWEECPDTDPCSRTRISRQQTQPLKCNVLLGVTWRGIVNIYIIQKEVWSILWGVSLYNNALQSVLSTRYWALNESEEIINSRRRLPPNENYKTFQGHLFLWGGVLLPRGAYSQHILCLFDRVWKIEKKEEYRNQGKYIYRKAKKKKSGNI